MTQKCHFCCEAGYRRRPNGMHPPSRATHGTVSNHYIEYFSEGAWLVILQNPTPAIVDAEEQSRLSQRSIIFGEWTQLAMVNDIIVYKIIFPALKLTFVLMGTLVNKIIKIEVMITYKPLLRRIHNNYI